jgi:uncharacterized protein YqgC (DUF456 family)
VKVAAVPSHPFLLLGPAIYYFNSNQVRFAPVWHVFFLFLIIPLFVQLAMKVLTIVNQHSAWARALKVIGDLLGAVSLGILAFAQEYFVPTSSAADLHTLASVNHAMTLAFRIGLFFAILGLLTESWKSIKCFIPTERLAF